MTNHNIGPIASLRYLAVIALIAIGVLSILATGGSGSSTTSFITPTVGLSLTQFATGLNGPVGVYNAGPGDDRLFVIERTGIIGIVQSADSGYRVF